MTFLRAASMSVLVLGACSSLDDSATDTNQQELPAPWDGCDEWGCGMNSPAVDIYGMHDFDGEVGGEPNKIGLRVYDIKWKNPFGVWKTLKRVYSAGAKLGATDGAGLFVGANPDGSYSGNSIVNLHIFLRDASGSMDYEIRVASTGRVKYWAVITGSEFGTSYQLEWDVAMPVGTDKQRKWENVCTNPPNDGSPDVTGGMNVFHSIVFEDDAINSNKKRIKSYALDPAFPWGVANSSWVNVGCAGHALAKLHLSGHTTGAVNEHGYALDFREFQTTLKMITADYCASVKVKDPTTGDPVDNPNEGYPFTVAGQPLEWLDAIPYNTYTPAFSGFKEAEWRDDGASCITKPRLVANPTATGTAMFADPEADIITMCTDRPPACADGDAYNTNGHHMISSNP